MLAVSESMKTGRGHVHRLAGETRKGRADVFDLAAGVILCARQLVSRSEAYNEPDDNNEWDHLGDGRFGGTYEGEMV